MLGADGRSLARRGSPPRDQLAYPTRLVHFAGAKSKPWKFPEVAAAHAATSGGAAAGRASNDDDGGSHGGGGLGSTNMSDATPPAVREWARQSLEVERRIRLNLPPLPRARALVVGET